jgi:hypothetical protein
MSSLNGSGASGTTYVSVTGNQVTVIIKSSGLSAKLPHAQHIHIGGTHMCPTLAADANHDGLISTSEGMDSYGDALIGLTTTGDVSVNSELAVSRYPIATNDGMVTYERTFTLPDGVSPADVANGVVVQHGDSSLFNDPTMYDGSAKDVATDPTLPLEATIPADCGKLVPIASSVATGSPYVTLSTYNGKPGSMVTVNGHNFGSYEPINLSLNNHATYAVFSDANGNFSNQLTVPNVTPAQSATLTAIGQTYQDSASANYYIGGYYPHAQPSSYYSLPGQAVRISGDSFAPNESIIITDTTNGAVITGLADGSGNFATSDVVVPFSAQNSTHNFTVAGTTSSTSVSFSIKVGTFYPQLSPSSYYVPMNSTFSASATGFAPGEVVHFIENGTMMGQAMADGGGNVSSSSLTVPTGPSFTLTAMGVSSGTSSSRTISAAQ